MHGQPPVITLDRNNVLQALAKIIAIAVGHYPARGVQHIEVATVARQNAQEPLRLTEQGSQFPPLQ